MRKLTLISLTILLLSLTLATPIFAEQEDNIETYNSEGVRTDEFSLGDAVYLKGKLTLKNWNYTVYIVKHFYDDGTPLVWKNGTTKLTDIKELVVYSTTVTTDKYGNIPLTNIWDCTIPGYYDIFVDNGNGVYGPNDGLDSFDVKGAGLFVISETYLGPIAMLLACFTAVLLKYRRPLSLRG